MDLASLNAEIRRIDDLRPRVYLNEEDYERVRAGLPADLAPRVRLVKSQLVARPGEAFIVNPVEEFGRRAA